jgi:HAD superfamily hydrolase (TIGR01509 family)
LSDPESDAKSTAGIRAVILDLDGTMLDTEAVDRHISPAAAARLGFHFDDEFYLSLVGQSNPDFEAALQARFGPAFSLPLYQQHRMELWQEQIRLRGIPIIPGVHELLEFLESEQLLFAIATSSFEKQAALKLRVTGLEARFRHVITASDVPAPKPAPYIHVEAARRLGLPANQCIAVEDSDVGVIAAATAGMIVLMVPNLKPPSSEAASLAFRILSNLHEVPDTVRLIIRNHPAD